MQTSKVIKKYEMKGTVKIPDVTLEQIQCEFCINVSDLFVEVKPEQYLEVNYCPMCGRRVKE